MLEGPFRGSNDRHAPSRSLNSYSRRNKVAGNKRNRNKLLGLDP